MCVLDSVARDRVLAREKVLRCGQSTGGASVHGACTWAGVGGDWGCAIVIVGWEEKHVVWSTRVSWSWVCGRRGWLVFVCVCVCAGSVLGPHLVLCEV